MLMLCTLYLLYSKLSTRNYIFYSSSPVQQGMSFSLPTIEEDNKKRIQEYWKQHTHTLQQKQEDLSPIPVVVRRSSNHSGWDSIPKLSKLDSNNETEVMEAELMYSGDSIIKQISRTGTLYDGLTMTQEVQEKQQSNRMRYICSIEQDLQKSQIKHDQNDKNKVQGIQTVAQSPKINWAGKLKYANSYSEKTVSDLSFKSIHQLGSKPTTAVQIKLSDPSRQFMKIENETHDGRAQTVSEFRMDQREQGLISGRQEFNPINGKIISMNNSRKVMKRHVQFHTHSQTTPVPMYMLQQPMQPVLVTSPPYPHPQTFYQTLTSPIRKSSLPTGNILKIDRVLEMSKAGNKSLQIPKKDGNRKLQLVTAKSNEKQLDSSRFTRLTDIYDQELAKNNIKINFLKEKKQKNKHIGGKPQIFSRCPYPFRIDTPCIDADDEPVHLKTARVERMTEAEGQQKQQLFLENPLYLQPTVPSQTLTSASRPHRHLHKGLSSVQYRSTELY